MRNKLLFALGSMLLLEGCAERTLVIPDTVHTPHEPPPLTEKQLLGLRTPRGLVNDSESSQYALRQVMESYWGLKEKAAKEGWSLILVSGHRSFYSQRRIWNRSIRDLTKKGKLDQKGRVRAVMSTVSVPGLSRHHWGTELDISEETLRGQLVKIQSDTPQKVLDFYQWMEQNAPSFGFCKVYLGNKGAVMDEPWHWTYFPFARVYEQQFMEIKDFSKIWDIKVEDVDYIMRNFRSILRKEIRSVNNECSGTEPEQGPRPQAQGSR